MMLGTVLLTGCTEKTNRVDDLEIVSDFVDSEFDYGSYAIIDKEHSNDMVIAFWVKNRFDKTYTQFVSLDRTSYR